MTATALPGLFDELCFGGDWRRYQQAAIAAFERDRADGRRRTHIVAPPGSGKTLLGVELVRRIGRRALVLTPNSAVQMQWPRAIRQFGSPADVGRTAGPEPAFPIACMTYQSLCQLDDPEIAARPRGRRALGRRAGGRDRRRRRGGRGRSATTAPRPSGARSEIARITAAVKREIARGEHAGVELADLLSADRQGARGGAAGRPRRRRRARRVPPPRLDVGLRGARRARRAGRRGRPRDRPHGHAAVRPDRRGDRALRRAARPGRLHRPDAGRGPRRPPRALPGAGVADRAAGLRARLAGRARHALQGAGHRAARGRRERALVPGLGDHARARAAPLGRRRRAGAVGGVPARAAGAGARRRAVPRLRRPGAAGGRAARRGLPARRPTSTTGSCCSRTTRCAACTRPPRARRPSATRRSPRRWPSSASGSRARGSGAAPRRSTGC